MSKSNIPYPPQDKRKNEATLSAFADYAAKTEQALRYGTAAAATGAGPAVEEPETSATSIFDDDEDLEQVMRSFDVQGPKLAHRHMFVGAKADEPEARQQLEAFVRQRVAEGHGETVYHLGFEDARSMGFAIEDWNTAYDRLVAAAGQVGASCQLLCTKNVGGELEIQGNPNEKDCHGKVLIRRIPQQPDENIETRIVVVGNVDAGKSSMLGVLVKGDLDDGRGSARVNLFRHKHEMESGRTSSVGMEILGFDKAGKVVKSDVPGRKLSWSEIVGRSAKVITFSDLAGHEKYLRTTVFGMLSGSPNYCLLMVAANNGLVGMSKEHLGIAVALNVPIMVVITKVDICPPQILDDTIKQLTKILKSPGARKIPVFIKDREACITTATQMVSQRICPVFQVSNVTGYNLDLVRTFLNILPHHGYYNADGPFEFTVNDTFSVPFVGTVVSGIVHSGVVHTGDTVLVGPDSVGQFAPTTIRSIERKRVNVVGASAGQSASLALRKVRRKDVRKGMVILPKLEGVPPPQVTREFVAEVLVLSHATTIKTRYQAMLHVGSISQTCAIIDVDRPYIRTGDKSNVAFRFIQRPEYVRPGERILFREGRTKGLGIITAVGYDPKDPLWAKKTDEAEGAESGNDNGTAAAGRHGIAGPAAAKKIDAR